MKPEDIKRLRFSRGETQRQFGAVVGVSAAPICQWEMGIHQPEPKSLIKLQELWAKSPLSKSEGLTAAASDMLAVLEEFRAAFETHEVRADFASGMTFGAIIERAKAAIAKAKGER